MGEVQVDSCPLVHYPIDKLEDFLFKANQTKVILNLEAGFSATLHDKGFKNSHTYVKPSKFTSIFESKRLLRDTPIFEPYDLMAGKTMPNTSSNVDSPVSKLAEVKRTLLQYLGPLAAVDELIASFISIPENRNELEHLDDLMYLASYSNPK